ncbi:MFS transporter [Pseudalkalibacillus decolorationis]|uniref:MFS transporter n=1 Tax=Pseudalkalibacillus decolorationis TaxID=163879 RepID=UPI00214839A9|nr:MFS transporter [Pseudalkalibacillus decolorationis]
MLKNRSYFLYLNGSVISAIGIEIHFIAISWLILEITNSTTKVGITLAISLLPLMFLASFGGIIADQYDRRIVNRSCIIFSTFQWLLLNNSWTSSGRAALPRSTTSLR